MNVEDLAATLTAEALVRLCLAGKQDGIKSTLHSINDTAQNPAERLVAINAALAIQARRNIDASGCGRFAFVVELDPDDPRLDLKQQVFNFVAATIACDLTELHAINLQWVGASSELRGQIAVNITNYLVKATASTWEMLHAHKPDEVPPQLRKLIAAKTQRGDDARIHP